MSPTDLCECGGGGWFLCQDAGHGEARAQRELPRAWEGGEQVGEDSRRCEVIGPDYEECASCGARLLDEDQLRCIACGESVVEREEGERKSIALHFLRNAQVADSYFENHKVTITINPDGFSYQWEEPYYFEAQRTQQRMREHMAMDLVRHGFEVQIKNGERRSLRAGVIRVRNQHQLELHARFTDQVDL